MANVAGNTNADLRISVARASRRSSVTSLVLRQFRGLDSSGMPPSHPSSRYALRAVASPKSPAPPAQGEEASGSDRGSTALGVKVLEWMVVTASNCLTPRSHTR